MGESLYRIPTGTASIPAGSLFSMLFIVAYPRTFSGSPVLFSEK